MSCESSSFNVLAKAVGRTTGPLLWLHPVLKRLGRGPLGRLGSELNFEARRQRHIGLVLDRIKEIELEVTRHEPPTRSAKPSIALFNTTTSPGWISFTSMIGLLTGWSLRMSGYKVTNWVCHSGMMRCPHGTYRYALGAPPPCSACVQVKREVFDSSRRECFRFDPTIRHRLALPKGTATLDELVAMDYEGIAVGRLCLPSLRHALKRHNLLPDKTTLGIYRDYLLSGANIVDAFTEFLLQIQPKAVVVFNGFTFPEAVARAVALQRDIPVVTYEVGFRPHSAFFSHGLAPECPIDIPSGFRLGVHEEQELDRCLEQRFGGDFTMGGVRFWPEMTSLGDEFAAKANQYQQVVSIYTNTVYDTSQVTANTVFASMFDWLEETLSLARNWPNTLFVVRAHPDEFRNGSQKSCELVGDWLEEKGLLSIENLLFVPPTQYISSYELVKVSKFCLVYNSTIGLEAVILGIPVICGGRTKYSAASFVRCFSGPAGYLSHVSASLAADRITFPPEWRDEARRFFYCLLFKASLDLSRYVQPMDGGDLTLRRFRAEELRSGESKEMHIILDGIVDGEDFFYALHEG